MVSRTVDKAQENEDIKQYEQKGQIVYLNKDLGQVCSWHISDFAQAALVTMLTGFCHSTTSDPLLLAGRSVEEHY